MQYFILPILFCLNLCCVQNLYAQTTEDIVQCLQLILERDDMEPAFQIDLFGGKTAVLLKQQSSFRPIDKAMNDIYSEDFDDLFREVEVMTEAAIKAEGILIENVLTYGLTYFPNTEEMDVILQTNLNEDRRQRLIAKFTLQKIAEEEWEIKSQAVDLVPTGFSPNSVRNRN